MLNIKKLIGGGKSENSLLKINHNSRFMQANTMLSLVMALCLSAFFVSIPVEADAKKPKTEKKKKEKKPKKDKKDKKDKKQQTATPFEVKNEQSNQKQL